MTQRATLIGQSLRLSTLAVAIVGSFCMSAQPKPSAAIPATAPTQSVSDLPSAHPAVTESTPRGKAHTTWSDGKLTVIAGGSALPEILQQVARATGMKITGGVPDERVFGTYGPGSVQAVMGQLFEGLSINMMLINGSATSPKELVLTARTGAVSPPQVREISNESDDPGPSRMPPFNQEPGRTFTSRQPRAQGPSGPNGPTPTQDEAPAVPEDNTADGGADQQSSPNGVRTPEQIFEELRKRQQQQQGEPTE